MAGCERLLQATGVDWTHPAFGGYTDVPNAKVVYAASYTGEPPADNFGHGSHVAGTAAGDDHKATLRGDSLVRGVAPKAKLMSYKVLTAFGSGSATNIIFAVEDAVKRGAHVLNLSLGDPSGDPNSPEAVACNNAMLAGTVVCAAAGNSGPARSTVGTPGAADKVLTVGASTDDGVTALYARVVGDGPPRAVEVRLMAGSVDLPDAPINQGFVPCGLGAGPADFPAAVKGNIALVKRGAATFREKAQNAQAAGAVACLVYNNQAGHFFGTLGEVTPENPAPALPVLSLSGADGDALAALPPGPEGVSRARVHLERKPMPQPDRLGEFSSRGPTRDGRIKPDLCAPGVDIYSATITPNMAPSPGLGNMADPTGYASVSGTSMATPHVAGAAALLKQAHPNWDALTIKAVLMNTARFMKDQGGPNDQGAGRIDLEKAIHAKQMLVTAHDHPQASYHFGVVEARGARTTVSEMFRVVDLGGKADARCRLRVRWAVRAPGLRARLSARELHLPAGTAAGFQLTLAVGARNVPEGMYCGLVEASTPGGVARLPFAVHVRGPGAAPADPPAAAPPAPDDRPAVPAPLPRPDARRLI